MEGLKFILYGFAPTVFVLFIFYALTNKDKILGPKKCFVCKKWSWSGEKNMRIVRCGSCSERIRFYHEDCMKTVLLTPGSYSKTMFDRAYHCLGWYEREKIHKEEERKYKNRAITIAHQCLQNEPGSISDFIAHNGIKNKPDAVKNAAATIGDLSSLSSDGTVKRVVKKAA